MRPADTAARLDTEYQAQDESSATRAAPIIAPIIIGAYRNGQGLGSFDQAQSNADVMEPFLQFAVHKSPLEGKTRRPTDADHS